MVGVLPGAGVVLELRRLGPIVLKKLSVKVGGIYVIFSPVRVGGIYDIITMIKVIISSLDTRKNGIMTIRPVEAVYHFPC